MCPGSPSTQGWCGMPGKAHPGVMGGFSHLPFCPASSPGHIGGARPCSFPSITTRLCAAGGCCEGQQPHVDRCSDALGVGFG